MDSFWSYLGWISISIRKELDFFAVLCFFPTFLLQTIKLELVATNVWAVLASQDAGSPIKLIQNFPCCRNGLTKRQGCEKPTSNCLPQNNVQERRHLGGCELISFYWLLNWPSSEQIGAAQQWRKQALGWEKDMKRLKAKLSLMIWTLGGRGVTQLLVLPPWHGEGDPKQLELLIQCVVVGRQVFARSLPPQLGGENGRLLKVYMNAGRPHTLMLLFLFLNSKYCQSTIFSALSLLFCKILK